MIENVGKMGKEYMKIKMLDIYKNKSSNTLEMEFLKEKKI